MSSTAHAHPPRSGLLLWAGAFAGVVVGAVDVALAWQHIGQFLPSFASRLAGVLHVATLYAAVSTIAGVLLGSLIAAFVTHTDAAALGRGVWSALARHHIPSPPVPLRAFLPLSYAISLSLLLLAALGGSYLIGLHTIRHRHHKGLVVVVVITVLVALVAAACVLGLIVARPLAWLLRAVAHRHGLRVVLTHPLAAPLALLAVATAAGAATAYTSRETLGQLGLRPATVGAGIALAFTLTLAALPRRIIRPLIPRRRAWRWASYAAIPLSLLAIALATGSIQGVRKAAAHFSGLGGPLAGALRRIVDLDRDGYSAVLGGADCDDWDAAIHPGATDIPDDGIDQNCIGGDTTVSAPPHDTAFVTPHSSIPPDLNVMMITIDAVRADHVGAYGYPRATTPRLDAVARRGTLFANAWAHAPSTRYSVPTILTGRYPSRVQWDYSVWWPGLLPANMTIAEVMRSRGLTTAAILNYRYFHRSRRMDQGFDHYDNSNASLHRGRDPASTSGTSSRQQADAAIRYLDRIGDRRFFLWVHFYDPHYRYERHPGTPSFGEKQIDLYDHEIRFTDDQIARVLDRIQALGLTKRTALVITADHGEGFGERGIQLHGYHLYAPQTRIPLIIHVPGLPPRKVLTPVGHIDLLPTLANLVGAPSDPQMLGRSLLGELHGSRPADADREIYQEVIFEGPTERFAVATRKWQLIYNKRPDNSFELYALDEDPEQRHDLWGRVAVEALQYKLLRWVDNLSIDPQAAAKLANAFPRKRPKPALPSDAIFGGTLRLIGADLAPREARPGQPLELTLYFEPLAPIDDNDWRIFVHVEGPGTRFLGDHEPLGGLVPLSRWRRGQFIADRHTLSVPTNSLPGTYPIYVGFFRGNNRMLVEASSATPANRLRVGSLRVTTHGGRSIPAIAH